jgi:hypothetical protein
VCVCVREREHASSSERFFLVLFCYLQFRTDFIFSSGWIGDEIERLENEKAELAEKVREAKSEKKEKLQVELERVVQYIKNANELLDACEIR